MIVWKVFFDGFWEVSKKSREGRLPIIKICRYFVPLSVLCSKNDWKNCVASEWLDRCERPVCWLRTDGRLARLTSTRLKLFLERCVDNTNETFKKTVNSDGQSTSTSTSSNNATRFLLVYSRAIVNNPDVTRAAPLTDIWTNDFWGTPIGSSSSHGSYRPLCVASFRLNHWTGGLDPKGYHAANVLLHCAVTYLVYAVYRTLMPGRRPAAAAAVFAVHPVHAEAVAGVVGRADLLACLFYLAAFLCYAAHVRHRDRTPDPRRRVVCCDAGCHRRTYRLGSAVRTVFAALGLGTCSSDLDGLPGGVTECCAVREWACLAATVLMAAASMLAKETGLTVLAVCAVYDMLFASKQSSNKVRVLS